MEQKHHYTVTLVSCPAVRNTLFQVSHYSVPSSRTFSKKTRIFVPKAYYSHMKPINERKHRPLELLIHIICWGMFYVFPLFLVQRNNGFIDWHVFMIHSMVPTSLFLIFYINYLVLIPQILFRERTKEFLIINFIIIVALTFILRYWNNLHFPPPMDMRRPAPPQYTFYMRDMASLIFAAGLSVAIRMSMRWSESEAARQEAIKSRTEAELKNLRNQLNPHFLFNSLNTLIAEIEYNPQNAVHFTKHLSSVYRYVLQSQDKTLVTLGEELEFIRSYLFLHEVRLGNCLTCQNNVPAEYAEKMLPPLTLQLLVENVIKHNSITPGKPMVITIRIEDEYLSVSNPIHPKKSVASSGIGLENLAKRCELMSGKKIIIKNETEKFTVKVPLLYE